MAAPALTSYSAATGQPINGGRWAGGRLSGDVALSAVAPAGTLGPNASDLSGNVDLSAVAPAGTLAATVAPFELQADGIWTYFSRPEAIYHSGYTYALSISSGGDHVCTRYKHADGSIESVTLLAASEVDDHNNGSLFLTPSGRLVAFYNAHNDAQIKYRVLNDLSGFATLANWSAQQGRGFGSGPFAYQCPIYLSADSSKQYTFNRRWLNGGGSLRALSYWAVSDWGTVPATFVAGPVDILTANTSNAWPYWNIRSNGVDRIDVIHTDEYGPSGGTNSSVYHFYMQLDGSNNLVCYQTDGTEITATKPFLAASSTLVYDGTTQKAWIQDVRLHADGKPRLVWPRFDASNTGLNFEYWYSRWTGSAWTSQKLCDGGPGFDASPHGYHRGVIFDSSNDDRIFMARQIAGVDTVEEWRSADAGVTWSQYRVIRSSADGGSPEMARPVSPRDHNGIAVIWHEGTFTDWLNYDTNLVAAG